MQALIQAMTSADLGEVPDGLGDIDWIRACGMAGQRHSTAVAVWKLCEMGDKRSLRSAFDGVMAEAARLDLGDAAVMATNRVLDWLMRPACPECHGRGFELIPGTPTLSDHACKACAGTGQRPRPWSDGEKALFDRVQELQSQAAAAIIRKIKADAVLPA